MLSKQQTNQLKGIAALLMIMHHCFTFLERQPYGYKLEPMTPITIQEIPLFK